MIPRAAVYGGRHKPSAEKPNLTNVEFDPAYTGVQCYKHLKMCFDYCDDYAYAYTFTTAAFDGVNTMNFSSGRLPVPLPLSLPLHLILPYPYPYPFPHP